MRSILQVYKILFKEFGQQGWWPVVNDKTLICEYHKGAPRNEEEVFEICVGAILTQNTSWKNVERVIKNLKENNLLSKEGILKIRRDELAEQIRSSGYYNQKAKKIKKFAEFLNSRKGVNRQELLRIWGVGSETADSMLLYAYNKPVFVIDAYTERIFSRLGYKEKGYEGLQKLFMDSLPEDVKMFKEYHALLVRLGKNFCKKKPECGKCPLRKMCKVSLF